MIRENEFGQVGLDVNPDFDVLGQLRARKSLHSSLSTTVKLMAASLLLTGCAAESNSPIPVHPETSGPLVCRPDKLTMQDPLAHDGSTIVVSDWRTLDKDAELYLDIGTENIKMGYIRYNFKRDVISIDLNGVKSVLNLAQGDAVFLTVKMNTRDAVFLQKTFAIKHCGTDSWAVSITGSLDYDIIPFTPVPNDHQG